MSGFDDDFVFDEDIQSYKNRRNHCCKCPNCKGPSEELLRKRKSREYWENMEYVLYFLETNVPFLRSKL